MPNSLDQFYTLESDVDMCIAVVKELYDLSKFEAIVEPSAGEGAFSSKLLSYGIIALDLEPMGEGIIEQDFLTYSPTFKNALTIGNPPFGRRGSLAKKFIKKASSFSNVIAFILPSIFMKPSFTNNLPPYLHLVKTVKGIDTFKLPDGKLHKVNCCFQIWEKKSSKREKIVEPNTHKDFTITHAHLSRTSEDQLSKLKNDNDFCIGQVTGKLADIENISKGSQYFIKDNTSAKTVRKVFEEEKLTQPHAYNMGAVSFSRADIVAIYTLRIAKNTS